MTADIDILALMLVRDGKERSRALPEYCYHDPANIGINFKRKEVTVDRPSAREQADQLLIEWHRWSAAYRPNLGAPRIAPYCQESVSSRQYDAPADLSYDRVHRAQMQAVDFCMDAIAVAMQQAIGTEMRNREVSARVWRSHGNVTYTEALDAIVPIMRKRGLFD